MSVESPKLTKKAVRDELFRRGELSFLLDPAQKELHRLFYDSKHKIMTWLLARRSGKSYTLCVLALEQCIKHPNSIVKFVSPTKLQVTNNVRPIFRQILEQCPEEISPEFRKNEFIYYFPNGSEIQLAGSDAGHAQKLRGSNSDIWFIDEAGSCTGLDDLIKSILLPTTLITKGKGILASTPPKEAEHEFLKYIEEAELRGSLVKKTIYDNPRINKDQIEEMIKEVGGINSDEAQRELFCTIIKDSKTSVIPEFTDELAKEIIKEVPRPPFFDTYVSMDLGFIDLTAVLFGYYDFRNDRLIIEDEISFNFNQADQHLKLLSEKILAKESSLWMNPLTNEIKFPYLRVSDINGIVTNELRVVSQNKLYFQNTKKDDKESAINNLRLLLANKKLIIHPRCVNLVRHLKNVKWGKGTRKDEFARSADNSHYDFVDALIYFARSVIFSKNPYPRGYDLNLRIDDAFIQNPSGKQLNNSNQLDVFRKIFGTRRKH